MRQALELALEALEHGLQYVVIHSANKYRMEYEQAITSLRQAIATENSLVNQEPVAYMRMPKVGDRVVCIEDEDLGTIQSLTAGGSPDIKFDDGSYGTYLLREFAELFRYADTYPYVATPRPPKAELLIEIDGEVMTIPQAAMLELYKFQEATGCDTADELAQPKAEQYPMMNEMIVAGGKALAKLHADSCGLDFEDVWKFYAEDHKADAKAVIEAAHGIKE